MYDDAIRFLARFKLTTYDVICIRAFDEVLKIFGAIGLLGAFAFIHRHLHSLAAGICYWIVLVTLALYLGNRVSYLLSGLFPGRLRAEGWRELLNYVPIVLISVLTMAFVNMAVDAVILAKGQL